MDRKRAVAIAERFLVVVNEKFAVEHAILFGSFAQGRNHADSDIDLALVFKEIDDRFDLQIQLMCLRDDDALLIEPHPFKASDFNRNNPMVAEILKNGIELKNFLANSNG
ncbi:MAG: nucleotidyltransferase domain-containing protein [Pricia sp.]